MIARGASSLVEVVSAVPTARVKAAAYRRKDRVGSALFVVGGVMIGTSFLPTNRSGFWNDTTATIVGGAGLAAATLGLIVGANAQADFWDAVNIYNQEHCSCTEHVGKQIDGPVRAEPDANQGKGP